MSRIFLRYDPQLKRPQQTTVRVSKHSHFADCRLGRHWVTERAHTNADPAVACFSRIGPDGSGFRQVFAHDHFDPNTLLRFKDRLIIAKRP